MTRLKIEARLTSLEEKIAELQTKVGSTPSKSWLDNIYGAFANDPVYDEAMRLGREYRESLRPRAPKKRGAVKKNGHSGHGPDHAARKGK